MNHDLLHVKAADKPHTHKNKKKTKKREKKTITIFSTRKVKNIKTTFLGVHEHRRFCAVDMEKRIVAVPFRSPGWW